MAAKTAAELLAKLGHEPGCKSSWRRLPDACTCAHAELSRRIAELEQDRERLDWLESEPEANEPIMVFHPPGDGITWRTKNGKEHNTLRAAIDAARGGGRDDRNV